MKVANRSKNGLRHLRICLPQLTFSILLICAFVGDATSEQTAFEKREAAYRVNNIGVALLEQYKPKEAAESFERALTIDPNLRLPAPTIGSTTRLGNFRACSPLTMKTSRPTSTLARSHVEIS